MERLITIVKLTRSNEECLTVSYDSTTTINIGIPVSKYVTNMYALYGSRIMRDLILLTRCCNIIEVVQANDIPRNIADVFVLVCSQISNNVPLINIRNHEGTTLVNSYFMYCNIYDDDELNEGKDRRNRLDSTLHIRNTHSNTQPVIDQHTNIASHMNQSTPVNLQNRNNTNIINNTPSTHNMNNIPSNSLSLSDIASSVITSAGSHIIRNMILPSIANYISSGLSTSIQNSNEVNGKNERGIGRSTRPIQTTNPITATQSSIQTSQSTTTQINQPQSIAHPIFQRERSLIYNNSVHPIAQLTRHESFYNDAINRIRSSLQGSASNTTMRQFEREVNSITNRHSETSENDDNKHKETSEKDDNKHNENDDNKSVINYTETQDTEVNELEVNGLEVEENQSEVDDHKSSADSSADEDSVNEDHGNNRDTDYIRQINNSFNVTLNNCDTRRTILENWRNTIDDDVMPSRYAENKNAEKEVITLNNPYYEEKKINEEKINDVIHVETTGSDLHNNASIYQIPRLLTNKKKISIDIIKKYASHINNMINSGKTKHPNFDNVKPSGLRKIKNYIHNITGTWLGVDDIKIFLQELKSIN
jgi:hypothetical protein